MAQDFYDQDFPYGHQDVGGGGEGFVCALRAVVTSIKECHPELPEPQMYSFHEILESREFKNTLGHSQDDGGSDIMIGLLYNNQVFSAADLDVILRIWGTRNARSLRLAWITDSHSKHVATRENDDESSLVWVRYVQQGSGYFGAVRPKSAEEALNVQIKQEEDVMDLDKASTTENTVDEDTERDIRYVLVLSDELY